MRGLSVTVRGIGQGVGFRPLVLELAERYGLVGWVCNADGQVEIEVDGSEEALAGFLRDLREEAPSAVQIDGIDCEDRPSSGYGSFEIVESRLDADLQLPTTLDLPFTATQDILAVGAHRKSTFCLVKESKAIVSQLIGDLEDLETLECFESSLETFERLFNVEPSIIAHDMHPDYRSTHLAHEYPAPSALRVVVQHHHAHVVSAMAEHGIRDTVIGVTYDGTGYGTDGAMWGGEILVADWRSFRRVAHLRYAPMLGGEPAIPKPYRMAAGYIWSLCAACEYDFEEFLGRIPIGERLLLRRQIETDLGTPPTSSCGNLFDAVAALLGIMTEAQYEGQSTVELEAAADPAVDLVYPYDIIREGDGWIIDPAATLRAVWCEVRAGRPVPTIAAAFHNTVADFTRNVCVAVREKHGLKRVVLSGACFQNALLTRRLLDGLSDDGFEVLTHRLLPPNDGGISLGQAVVAYALTEGI